MTPLCGAVVVNKEGHLAATVEQIAAIIDAEKASVPRRLLVDTYGSNG